MTLPELCRYHEQAVIRLDGVARREKIDMRTAAYLLAVQRVADATQMRGLYPSARPELAEPVRRRPHIAIGPSFPAC